LLLLDEPTTTWMWKPSSGLEGYLVGADCPWWFVSPRPHLFSMGLQNQIVGHRARIRPHLSGQLQPAPGSRNKLERDGASSRPLTAAEELASQQPYIDRISGPVPPAATQAQEREKLLEKVDRIEARWRASPAQVPLPRCPRSAPR